MVKNSALDEIIGRLKGAGDIIGKFELKEAERKFKDYPETVNIESLEEEGLFEPVVGFGKGIAETGKALFEPPEMPGELSPMERLGTYWQSKAKMATDMARQIWKDIPVNPFYWKTPQEKTDIENRDRFEQWAGQIKTQDPELAQQMGIDDPGAYADRMMAEFRKRSGAEIAVRAYEPQEGQVTLPETTSAAMFTPRQGETAAERFIGEWVSGFGIGAFPFGARVAKPIGAAIAKGTQELVTAAKPTLKEIATSEVGAVGKVPKKPIAPIAETAPKVETLARKVEQPPVKPPTTIEIRNWKDMGLTAEDIAELKTMSPELRVLHTHQARLTGFQNVANDAIDDYLQKALKLAKSRKDTKAIDSLERAIEYNDAGSLQRAALDSEKGIGFLHQDEIYAIRTARQVAREALSMTTRKIEQPPPVKPPISEVIGTPEPVTPKNLMPDLQPAQQVADIAFREDMARKIGNLPGIKQINKYLNPSAVADDPARQSLVVQAVLRDEGMQKYQAAIAHLNELGNQQKVFGSLDDAGRLAQGKLKGLSLNDIRTYPERYPGKFTTAQKEWIKRANDLEKAKLDFLRRNGIEINELTFQEGGQYAGRRVYARATIDGDILDTAYVGAGGRRPGAKISVEKMRVFASADEAVKAGYRYLPEDEALALNIQAAYNRVADKIASDWLLTKIPWRTSAAPESLILAAEAAKLKAGQSSNLLKLLNRAVRGERVAVSKEVANVYPEQATKVKALVPKLQAGEAVGDEVQALTIELKKIVKADKRAMEQAVNARARAREAALRSKLGEATVRAPAFSGKVLTGTEARKTADILNRAYEAQINPIVNAVNKVNAVTRYVVLAGDASVFGIQLIALPFTHPQIAAQAARGFIKAFASPEFQAKQIAKQAGLIARHPNLIVSRSGQTEFTEAMARGGILAKRPLTPVRKALEPFQRGFEAAIDETGFQMAAVYERTAKTPAKIADLDQFINEFRGITSSARLGVTRQQQALETVALLAPRYNRAIAGLLFDLFRGGIRGKLAREHMIKLTAGMAALAVGISYALGEDEDEMVEHLDPRSSKFFTWNIAGQNIGPGSKIRSVLKVIADSSEDPDKLLEFTMENPALRFVRGNLSLSTGSAVDLMTGSNFIGDPTRDGMLSFSEEVLARNMMPIWMQSTIFEGGNIQERTFRGAAEFAGGRAYPETDWQKQTDLRNKYAQADYKLDYTDLNNAQKADLRRAHSDLVVMETEIKTKQAERGSTYEQWYLAESKRQKDERNNALALAAQSLLDGSLTKKEYDDNRSYVRPYYSGAKDVLWSARQAFDPKGVKELEAWASENTKPEDQSLDAYWGKYNELLDKSELPLDWDKINAELDKYLNTLKPEIRQYILDHKDDWIKDLPEPAKTIELQRLKGIEDESWWDDYQGRTPPTYQPPKKTERKNIMDYLGGTQEPEPAYSGAGKKRKTIMDYLK